MGNNTKKPLEKAYLAILAMLLFVGLAAPSVTGYVNNSSKDFDNDMKSAVILENALTRLADRGEIVLSKELSAEVAEVGISGLLGEVPEVRQKGYFFCLDVNTGKVNVKNEKAPDEIILNRNKND